MDIVELGSGSWVLGTILTVFSMIGLVNAFAAFMMWFKKFLEWLERLEKKETPRFLLWIITIAVAFGWYALLKIITLL